MACRLISNGPLASLLVVLAVSWTLAAVAMAVREAGMPPRIHNTTATKNHSAEGGGGQRIRGEENGHGVFLNKFSISHTPPGHLHTSAPRPSHANSMDNYIEKYVKSSDTTSNTLGPSARPIRTPGSSVKPVSSSSATPPSPCQADDSTSSTQAHVGGPRRQVVAPADLILTPSLRLLLQQQTSSTSLPVPEAAEELSSGSNTVEVRGEEEGEGKDLLPLDKHTKFCQQVEDLLLSLTRGGSANSTRPHENLQTAPGQLLQSFSVKIRQKPNKTSRSAATLRGSSPPAQLLVQHMDGSPVQGPLVPTLPYKDRCLLLSLQI
ncbi:uncharacterized protein LOC135108425 isoform X2 [Scylla paramamosain]|uniref:uncharacterized protein LOC135108425 isoform X2 n=1 Tax=Scylla paramamosain TaxID=85552 RepID=UPI003083D0C6